jgi:hypothetical protein
MKFVRPQGMAGINKPWQDITAKNAGAMSARQGASGGSPIDAARGFCVPQLVRR